MTDPVAATPDPTGGDDPAHVQAMLDRADGNPPPADPGSGDQLLAGKYKTTEELEKGYLELQKAFSSRDPGTPSDPPADPPPAEPSEPSDPPADPNPDLPPRPEPQDPAAGPNFEKYAQSLVEHGALTDADYAELQEKHNLPRDVVDVYVAGLKAQSDALGRAAADAVGGAENLETIRKWASQSLSDAEYEATRSQIAGAKTGEELALIYQVLQAKYNKANPPEPNLAGGRPAGDSVVGFRSVAEQNAAIQDPRYENDPAYRADVEKRILASNL